jgi:superoxide dismutase, Fe-Mn family
MDKRTFIKTGLILGAGSILAPAFGNKKVFDSSDSQQSGTEFTQVPLGFAFNALEPHIDGQTMELHYGKHHATYTSRFNTSVRMKG